MKKMFYKIYWKLWTFRQKILFKFFRKKWAKECEEILKEYIFEDIKTTHELYNAIHGKDLKV